MSLISKLTRWFKGSPITSSPLDSIRKWYKGEPYTTLSEPLTTTQLALPPKLSVTFIIHEPSITATFNDQQRVSQIYTEYLYETEPLLKTSQIYVEFLYTTVSGQPSKQSLTFTLYEPTITAQAVGGIIHASAVAADVLYSKEPQVSVSASAADVLYSKEPQVSVSALAVDVLYSTSINVTNSLPILTLNCALHEPLAAIYEWDVNYLYYNEIFWTSDFSVGIINSVSLQHVTFGLHEPTIKADCHLTIDSVQSLIFNSYDPTISIIFHPGHLTFEQLAPEVRFAQTVPISKCLPLAFELSLPTAHFSFVEEVSEVQSLTFQSHDAIASLGSAIHETLSLTFSTYDHIAYLFTSQSPLPSGLTFQLHEPDVRVFVTPITDIVHLQHEQFDVTIQIGAVIETVRHLYFNKYNPLISLDYIQVVDEVLPLRFNLRNPVGLIFEATPFKTPPIRVEGEYCAFFDMLNEKAYFNRPNANLSSGFPGRYNDGTRTLTLTCWVRLISYYGWQTIVCLKYGSGWQNNGWALEFHTYTTHDSGFLNICYPQGEYPYTGVASLATGVNLSLNTWYHVALMIDGTGTGTPTTYGLEPYAPAIYMRVWDHKNKRIHAVYRNSREKQSDLYTETIMMLSTADFQIGCGVNNTDFLDGYLDEVVLFNAIRSPLETDTIRKFQYNGQIAGTMVEEFGQQVGYIKYDGVEVSEFGQQVGYLPANGVVVSEFGLQVGYRVEVPEVISLDPVIAGVAPSFESEITYKFESDVFKREEQSYVDDGIFTESEERKPKIGLPLHSAKATLNAVDEPAFLRMAEVVRSGSAIFSIPLWCFKQNITEDVKKGDYEFTVSDTTEFREGEKTLLVRASDFLVYELCTNTGTDGPTKVTVSPVVRHHYSAFKMPTATEPYDARSSYAIPCITGALNVESVEFARGPTFSAKVHVDGGVWTKAPMPSSPVESFTLMPQIGRLLAPQISREALGTDHGMLSLMNYMETSKIVFELEWQFHNTDWKLIRELFFSAMGRYGSFFIPMWLWEVKVINPATFDNLSQNLELQVTWPHNVGDDNMWKRFKKIYFQSHVDATKSYIVTLDDYNPATPAVFTVSAVTPSPFTIRAGDRGSIGVDARFVDDSLTFEFLGPNLCHVKASFTEAL